MVPVLFIRTTPYMLKFLGSTICIFYKDGPLPASFSFISSFLFKIQLVDEAWQMLGFEPRISGVWSDRSTNWATTPALRCKICLIKWWHHKVLVLPHLRSTFFCANFLESLFSKKLEIINNFAAIKKMESQSGCFSSIPKFHLTFPIVIALIRVEKILLSFHVRNSFRTQNISTYNCH